MFKFFKTISSLTTCELLQTFHFLKKFYPTQHCINLLLTTQHEPALFGHVFRSAKIQAQSVKIMDQHKIVIWHLPKVNISCGLHIQVQMSS